jgi:hypothetical protein
MSGRIAALGELAALARSHVERDRWNREIAGVPVSEGNTRLPQQLCQVARGSALLDGRDTVSDEDYSLVCRAALDSMPPARRAVLLALVSGESPYTLGLPPSTTHRALEDLQAVGVVRGDSESNDIQGGQVLPAFILTDEAQALVGQACLSNESLSRKWGMV